LSCCGTKTLASLDGMILVGQEEFQPDGRALLTYWEWQSGIPIPPTTTAMDHSPASPLNTATDAIDSNRTESTEGEQG
jgi:uncharacterized membrane protein